VPVEPLAFLTFTLLQIKTFHKYLTKEFLILRYKKLYIYCGNFTLFYQNLKRTSSFFFLKVKIEKDFKIIESINSTAFDYPL
jgi:hypothetical protein